MPRSSVDVATTARSVPGGHGGFHLASLLGVERAVVKTNRQVQFVDAPQVLEQQLGLHARIDEQRAELAFGDGCVDFFDGVAGGVAHAGHRVIQFEDVDVRLGAPEDVHQLGHFDPFAGRRLGSQVGTQFGGPGDGRPKGRRYASRGRWPANRAMFKASRSPRLVEARAWSSSRMIVSRPANNSLASGWLNSSAICSGVVIKISGGAWRWRARRATDVSPVRVSVRIGSCISEMGAVRLRATSTASAFSGEIYSVCKRWDRLRRGPSARLTRLGRNPASVLPAPVGAIQ